MNVELDSDDLQKLKDIRKKFPKNVITSYLNINSIRNKFESLAFMLKDKVDVLTIAETKLDESFPNSQFLIEGFKIPYRFDVTSQKGGLLTYVRSGIPSRQLTSFNISHDFQIIPIELNLRKLKWLLISIYRPPSQCLSEFLNSLSRMIDFFSVSYERIVVNGDFNATSESQILTEFLENHSLFSHVKETTCWKSQSGS